ncbi:tyrosine-type recombinase/integrase [Silvanigrella aquatica]|uniref:Integrase n=1 Tax=Silvanigrella aquatica TaxID=1915309 RepID=A0A1L4D4W7_9BACT|nr:tyrosine-type recombinase/integrase [Silvanigrella aquatica]APJ05251.1 hypothetical protein AXG55_14610 [Silvanigrella aquatica]
MYKELICYNDVHSWIVVEGSLTINFEKTPPKIAQERADFLRTFTAKNTKEAYNRALDGFFRFWESQGLEVWCAADFRRAHLDEWKQKLTDKHTPSSAGSKLAPLLSFFRFAYDSNWTTQDIGKGISLPRVKKGKAKTEALTEDELKRILTSLQMEFDAATEPNIETAHRRTWLRYCVFMTLCSVGMRVSELVNLKIEDLDLTGEFPRLNLKLKGGELHAPLIPDDLAALLKKYVVILRRGANSKEPLFTLNPLCWEPLERKYIGRLIDAIAKENNVTKKISPHSCRATVASLLHKNGVPIGEIQDLLGHRSILTTMMYIKKIDEEKQSAARKNPLFNLTR